MENTLGNRIRSLRDERRLSQREMAVELNITNVQLSRYESGARKPDPETLVQIADFLDVSTDYLLGRTSLIRESAAVYLTQEDIHLLELLKKSPDLMQLIHELSGHPDDAEMMLKIWSAIKER